MGRTFSAVPYTYLKRGVYYFVRRIRLASIGSLAMVLTTAATASNFNLKEIEINEPQFSKYFFGDSVSGPDCLYGYSKKQLSVRSSDLIYSAGLVIGYDWQTDHDNNSDSLTVRHENVSVPIRDLFALAILANDNSENNAGLKSSASDTLVKIAEENTLSETATVSEARAKGTRCYAGNAQTSAVCNFHAPEFAMVFAGNYLISASLLKKHLTPSQVKEVDRYVDYMYEKYINPVFDTLNRRSTDFSQMANGGIAALAYAYWKQDSGLAQTQLTKVFKNIDRVFAEDGYIKGTSFRGVRGFWYHTFGVNSALATIHLAEAWGVSVPDHVLAKVKAATELINLGISDINKFAERASIGRRPYNASYDELDTRSHVHQQAIAIDMLALRSVDISLNIGDDSTYLWKSKREYPSDFSIGYNPLCSMKTEFWATTRTASNFYVTKPFEPYNRDAVQPIEEKKKLACEDPVFAQLMGEKCT